MKYKVVCTLPSTGPVVMVEDCTCLKALNTVCGIMQGVVSEVETLKVEIFYKTGSEQFGFHWNLENSFTVKGK